MRTRTALIIGASGLVGGFCLHALLAETVYGKIISLGRRKLAVSDARLEQQMVDFGNPDTLQLLAVDDVFCTIGTTIRKAGSQQAFRQVDYDLPLSVARAALSAGATQFMLVSSVGADPVSGNFYLRTKGELEQALSKLPFTAVHIFRPSFLMGPRQDFRLGEMIALPVAKLLQYAMVGGLKKYHPISAETVARAMVAAAQLQTSGVHFYEYGEIKGLGHGARSK
jgi:uncharacterized protein YbjT (DUF2867 family)